MVEELKEIQPMGNGQQPQTIVQAGGRVAESLVGGFSGAPSLLLIVILNIIMILTAGYYFLQQEQLRNDISRELVTLLKACIVETVPIRQMMQMQAPLNPQQQQQPQPQFQPYNPMPPIYQQQQEQDSIDNGEG